MTKQCAKTKVFTAERLSSLQSSMREAAQKALNDNGREDLIVAEKEKGRNKDIPKASLDEYYLTRNLNKQLAKENERISRKNEILAKEIATKNEKSEILEAEIGIKKETSSKLDVSIQRKKEFSSALSDPNRTDPVKYRNKNGEDVSILPVPEIQRRYKDKKKLLDEAERKIDNLQIEIGAQTVELQALQEQFDETKEKLISAAELLVNEDALQELVEDIEFEYMAKDIAMETCKQLGEKNLLKTDPVDAYYQLNIPTILEKLARSVKKLIDKLRDMIDAKLKEIVERTDDDD